MRVRVMVSAAVAMLVVSVLWAGGSSPTSAAATTYVPLSKPARLLDTRAGEKTVDGEAAGIGARRAGSTYRLQVAGRASIAADAAAVVVNVTVTEPQGFGYATVFPCGVDTPNASNLNYAPGQTIPNAAIVKIGGGGDVCLYTLATAHFIVDVSGWFPAAAYTALDTPARLLDTRDGGETLDGRFAARGIRSKTSTLTLDVAGRAGIPDDAAAVVLNVTVTEPNASGYATMFPCDAGQPTASNVNHTTGETIANLAIARLAADGTVCLYTLARAHYVVDVAGYFPAGTFTALDAPARLLDTRAGESTADGKFEGIGTRRAQSSLRLDISGRVAIPANAAAVVLNVTVANPQAAGFATVFPRGVKRPNASNLNYAGGQTIPNAVIAKLGVGGDVCVFTLVPADYIVDVAGYIIGNAPATSGDPCPPTPTTTTTTTTTTIAATTTTTTTPANCSAAYPDFCIPPPPPDLNCGDIVQKNFTVLEPDPHGFDTDNDGIGCEQN